MRPGRANSEWVGLPPLVEGLISRLDRECRFCRTSQACEAEQPDQVAGSGARQAGFVVSGWVGIPGGAPEHRQRRTLSPEVPDGGRNDAAGARYAAHLRETT